MSTRAFTLYQLTALARLQHIQGHSAVECNVSDDLDEIMGERHYSHPEFLAWSREYHALVAQPVMEMPSCPKCFNFAGVSMWIPGRAMGGGWVPGVTIKECGYCGHRLSYTPDRY